MNRLQNQRLNTWLRQAKSRLFACGFCSESGQQRKRRNLARSTSIHSGVDKADNTNKLEEEDERSRRTLTKSLVGENVHASYSAKAALAWRKRPLFSRAGVNVMFETGADAAALLVNEAQRRDPYQVDFLQSVEEVAYDVAPAIEQQPKLAWVFKQLMEPERLVTFRVPWMDDNGNARLNRGYQIQYSSTLGPYRGGLRFHPHISHGSIRMLGWEQTLKNALTPIPFGGSKAGSDFDPSYKSEKEIKRFCDSFMKAVTPFLSKDDAFESDLNVGAKEIRYLKESYFKALISERIEEEIATEQIRQLFGSTEEFPEAAGIGCAFFAQRALEEHLDCEIKGLRCILSGAGSLARSTAAKLIELGAMPITLSDTSGFIIAKEGLTPQDLEQVAGLKGKGKSLQDFSDSTSKALFVASTDTGSIWEQVEGDIAFPCITQGEINVDDALALESSSCIAVFECSDRSCTTNARIVLQDRNILFGPSKAVNSGSIVASGFFREFREREGRTPTSKEIEARVKLGIQSIHDTISDFAERYDSPGDLKAGANLASFLRISEKELPS